MRFSFIHHQKEQLMYKMTPNSWRRIVPSWDQLLHIPVNSSCPPGMILLSGYSLEIRITLTSSLISWMLSFRIIFRVSCAPIHIFSYLIRKRSAFWTSRHYQIPEFMLILRCRCSILNQWRNGVSSTGQKCILTNSIEAIVIMSWNAPSW